MSVAVWCVAVIGSSVVPHIVSVSDAIAPRSCSARASVRLSLIGHPVDLVDDASGICDSATERREEVAIKEAGFGRALVDDK